MGRGSGSQAARQLIDNCAALARLLLGRPVAKDDEAYASHGSPDVLVEWLLGARTSSWFGAVGSSRGLRLGRRTSRALLGR